MRKLFSGLIVATIAMPLGALAPTILVGSAGCAFAQTAPDPAGEALVQIQLTEAQVQQYIAAEPDMEALLKGAPQATAGDTLDPKFIAKLEAAAKKHKFTNYDEFEAVGGNIEMAIEGIDPKTKKYIGVEAFLKQQIAEVEADAKMSAKDKKAAIDEYNSELKAAAPVKFKSNIDLVLKYYDQLGGAEGQKS